MNSPKIIAYMVVSHIGFPEIYDMIDAVNARIREGYVPQRGITTTSVDGQRCLYCQAMVKYEPKDQHPLIQIK